MPRDSSIFQSDLRTPCAWYYCTKQEQVSFCPVLIYNLRGAGMIIPGCDCYLSMPKCQLPSIHNQYVYRSSSPREPLLIILSSTQQLTRIKLLCQKKIFLIKDLIIVCTFQTLKQIVALKKEEFSFLQNYQSELPNWQLHTMRIVLVWTILQHYRILEGFWIFQKRLNYVQ